MFFGGGRRKELNKIKNKAQGIERIKKQRATKKHKENHLKFAVCLFKLQQL